MDLDFSPLNHNKRKCKTCFPTTTMHTAPSLRHTAPSLLVRISAKPLVLKSLASWGRVFFGGGTLCSVVSTGNGVLKERHTHVSTGQRYTYPSHIRGSALFCGFHREPGPEGTTHPFEHRPKIHLPFPRPGEPFVLWFPQGTGLKERHTHLSTGQRYTYHSHIPGNPLFCGRGPERTTHLLGADLFWVFFLGFFFVFRPGQQNVVFYSSFSRN